MRVCFVIDMCFAQHHTPENAHFNSVQQWGEKVFIRFRACTRTQRQTPLLWRSAQVSPAKQVIRDGVASAAACYTVADSTSPVIVSAVSLRPDGWRRRDALPPAARALLRTLARSLLHLTLRRTCRPRIVRVCVESGQASLGGPAQGRDIQEVYRQLHLRNTHTRDSIEAPSL